MLRGHKMLNHGVYQNLFSHFISIFGKMSVSFSVQEYEFGSQSFFCYCGRKKFQSLIFVQYMFHIHC